MQNGKKNLTNFYKNALCSISLASGQELGFPIICHIAMDSEGMSAIIFFLETTTVKPLSFSQCDIGGHKSDFFVSFFPFSLRNRFDPP